jgi:prepilin-type N-terminal cleavage/methylation domain-containing protein
MDRMGKRGFTLIEVLVAVAVVGISLGTLMLIFSQGHRIAYRAELSAEAACGAERLLKAWAAGTGYPASEQGQIEGLEGWSYEFAVSEDAPIIGIGPVSPGFESISEAGAAGSEELGDAMEGIEPEGLRLATLKLFPPTGRSSPFVLEFLVTERELAESESE